MIAWHFQVAFFWISTRAFVFICLKSSSFSMCGQIDLHWYKFLLLAFAFFLDYDCVFQITNDSMCVANYYRFYPWPHDIMWHCFHIFLNWSSSSSMCGQIDFHWSKFYPIFAWHFFRMCVFVCVCFFCLNWTFFVMCMFLLLEFNPYHSHHFGNFSQANCNPSWGLKGDFLLEFSLCYNKCFWSF